MSGDAQVVFVRSKTVKAVEVALADVLGQEVWPARCRRVDVAEADVSPSGWTLLLPIEKDFFLARGGLGASRLARLAKALRTAAFEVDVRSSVATTLFEADPLGRMRISGSRIYFVGSDGDEPEPTGQSVASKEVGFGLLPVTPEIHARIAELQDDPRLPDYLGGLAGFPAWRRDEISGELLTFEPSPAQRAPSPARKRR